jgi:hypothetical protein
MPTTVRLTPTVVVILNLLLLLLLLELPAHGLVTLLLLLQTQFVVGLLVWLRLLTKTLADGKQQTTQALS